VIGSYHEFSNIEKSFRMSNPYLRDSIEAHPTIVLAALAVSRWIEAQTGLSIRKFVKTAAAIAPSRSRPGRTPSPSPRPPPCPPTSGQLSTKSTADQLRTDRENQPPDAGMV
jgi:hypothetical protein